MHERVLPAAAVLRRQVAESGDHHHHPALIEQLKAQAPADGHLLQPPGEGAEIAAAVEAAGERAVEVTGSIWSRSDVGSVLAHASTYLEALGHIMIAWMWLEQWLAAAGRAGTFYEGKRQAARYFVRVELPRTGSQLDLIENLDRTVLRCRTPASDRPSPAPARLEAQSQLDSASVEHERLAIDRRRRV